ncbi:OmpA family protein [Pedobacter sp. MC2016-14]|uniref:OmpA family protein n=1 Tax=Pedobacter sp. MC2016-14 TaxID=2897327 RepID=UPI001E34040F|nr:OmpA family protein [Pedobacter sp. MC2016-14]MCD0490134.1 OmpA family protein [Pedobacter sp. MC2016-14]
MKKYTLTLLIIFLTQFGFAQTDAREYFKIGRAFSNKGDYLNAKKNYQLFIDTYKGTDPVLKQLAEKHIRDCDFSIQAMKSPEQFKLLNMGPGINSGYRDYFPAITADGETIIFSRNVGGNEDFYVSKKKNSEWQAALPLSDQINTKAYNEGAQSISPDGMYLFFTGCNRPDGLGRCDIYVSHRNGNEWGKPFNLGAPLNSAYWDSQPAITPDGSTLYFVSNRPGGLGGYDIWKSTLNDEGEWEKPINLGPEINTAYDEHTPFIHPDGKTMYFSSDGWPGFGNKDLFYSRLDEHNNWAKPVNLGYPINTFNEETGLIVTPDGTEGLLSSNIAGGFGDMDIYRFKMPQHAKPQLITYVKGIVKDRQTSSLLEARIQVVDLKSKHAVYSDYTSESGDFLAVMPIGSDYAFNVSADGYLFYSQNFELNKAYVSKPFVMEILMDKIRIGTDVTLRNIFFDTNKYELLESSVVELNNLVDLLVLNKNIAIEIQGHTDNIGNSLLNEKLSLNRAKAVYDYLVAHKINPVKLSYKGLGAKNPLVTNDTEEGRKQNRRTSFIITKL